jgi:hypothetical protein
MGTRLIPREAWKFHQTHSLAGEEWRGKKFVGNAVGVNGVIKNETNTGNKEDCSSNSLRGTLVIR